MSHTLYATFATPEAAEKATGALIDQGVRAEDLSVVRHPHEGYTSATEPSVTASNVTTPPAAIERDPTDVTATRADLANGDLDDAPVPARAGGDAEAGAVKGGLIGAGIGAVAVIAALVVPGVGLVLGAGALASALGGVIATAGAGAATGALVAYLKDLGLEDDVASEYRDTVESGGAILAVTVPSGAVDEDAANAVLKQFGATNVNRYASREYVA